MQMSNLEGDEYVKVRHNIMELVYELRKSDYVYFYNEFIQKAEEFDPAKFNPYDYLDEINKCDYFIAIFSEKIVSSIYFEVGYALGKEKNLIYFIKDEKVLPTLMRIAGDDLPKVQIIKTDSLPEILARMKNIINNERNSK